MVEFHMKTGLEFMKICDYCGGTGKHQIIYNMEEVDSPCRNCNGNGDVLTEIGKSLLEFVKSKLFKKEMEE